MLNSISNHGHSQGGEMAGLVRAFDWSSTPVGPQDQWPQSLRTTVSILLASKFPMFLWWGEDLIQFYNDAYRPSLGREGNRPVALGQRAEECWPEIWPTIHPLIEQVRSGGDATWSEDQRIPIYRNGRLEEVYWTFGYSPVVEESGKVGGVLVVCQETTSKVHSVRQLQESEQRFQNLVREATVGIIVLKGARMLVEIVNNAYGRLIGRPVEELLSRPLFEVIPETEAAFRPILDGVRLTGEPLSQYQHPYLVYVNGEKKEGYLNLVYQPYRESDGTITGVMVLCQDVTTQVVARLKLEESRQRFATLADHIPNLAWMANPDGGIFWYNRRWYDYTGTTAAQMEGWGWQSVHDPLTLPKVMVAWKHSIASGEPFQMVFPLKGADGVYRLFLTRVEPIRDPAGRIVQWFGTNTDIEEQQQAQQQLQALNRQLATTLSELAAANQEIQASNEELAGANRQLTRINGDMDNFIYMASHDLKAPIVNIEGLLKALLRTLPAESLASQRTRQITSLMQDSVERFRKTIADLTDIVRLQKENSREHVLVDLSAVVREVMLDLEPMIASSGAQVSAGHFPPVRFSEKNLRSVVYNLLSNALKYCSPERIPRISITCESTPACQVLTVTDNGLGIEAGRIDKLFTMFKRFHTHVEGSGIGLYMIKRMVEQAGGNIEAESREGQGSTFRVYFPQ